VLTHAYLDHCGYLPVIQQELDIIAVVPEPSERVVVGR
jgi:predicted metal-dependent RNase